MFICLFSNVCCWESTLRSLQSYIFLINTSLGPHPQLRQVQQDYKKDINIKVLGLLKNIKCLLRPRSVQIQPKCAAVCFVSEKNTFTLWHNILHFLAYRAKMTCQVSHAKSNCLVYLFIHFWDNKTLHPRNSITEPANWYTNVSQMFHHYYCIYSSYWHRILMNEQSPSFFIWQVLQSLLLVGFTALMLERNLFFLPPALVTSCKTKNPQPVSFNTLVLRFSKAKWKG